MNRRIYSLALLTLLSSCGWDTMPDDDAGDEAWVLQALPTLAGRNARSMEEVEALASLASTQGREVVADRILNLPETDRYWAMVLLEKLKISIDDTARFHVSADCVYPESKTDPNLVYDYGHYTPVPHTHAQILVNWLRDPAMATSNPPTFVWSPDDVSYSELLQAAVQEDALDVVMPAYLVMLANSGSPVPTQTGWEEGNIRQALADRMLERVVGRDRLCVSCHNTGYSVTDGSNPLRTWDRHVPMGAPTPDDRVDVESALFDYVTADGEQDGAFGGPLVDRHVADVMHSGIYEDCTGAPVPGDPSPTCTPTFRPWNLRDTCVVRKNNLWNTPGRRPMKLKHPVALNSVYGRPVHASFAGLQPGVVSDDVSSYPSATNVNVLTLSAHLTEGIQELKNPGSITVPPTNEPSDLLVQATIQAYGQGYTAAHLNAVATTHRAPPSCTQGCHTSGDAFLAKVPDSIIRDFIPTTTGGMAFCPEPGRELCLDSTLFLLRQQTVPVGSGSISLAYDPPDRLGSPKQDFAYVVAQNLTNIILEEVVGEGMVLSHGFSRHADQAQILGTLTSTLVDSDWSLRAVLKEVVLSKGFNRTDPADSVRPTAYEVTAATNPWRLQDGAILGSNRFNSQGDLIHRWSISNLSQRVHHALGWPSRWAPAVGTAGWMSWEQSINGGNEYPSIRALSEVGAFYKTGQEGVDAVNLPTWLAWEQHVGFCEKPTEVVRDPTNPTHAGLTSRILGPNDWEDWIDVLMDEPVSREQAVRLVRERLLQDPNLLPDEQVAVDSMFSGSMGQSLIGSDEDEVRAYCGALLKSPQFMLAGMPSTQDASAAVSAVNLPLVPFLNEPSAVPDWCAYHGGTWTGNECQ